LPVPITLFTGQWADSLAELAPLQTMGYDGLELACWGDHFDVQRRWPTPTSATSARCWKSTA
jgi:hypothetical protein